MVWSCAACEITFSEAKLGTAYAAAVATHLGGPWAIAAKLCRSSPKAPITNRAKAKMAEKIGVEKAETNKVRAAETAAHASAKKRGTYPRPAPRGRAGALVETTNES